MSRDKPEQAVCKLNHISLYTVQVIKKQYCSNVIVTLYMRLMGSDYMILHDAHTEVKKGILFLPNNFIESFIC